MNHSGFSTNKQKYTYAVLGFIFWQSIILATNFAGIEKLGPVLTFKTLNCGRSYKQCMLDFSFNECYPRFKRCMQEFGDFEFPQGEISVIEESKVLQIFTYSEEEQQINLKRCRRLNFYGKK